jgi:D-alanyl-D-alanine dipeptidase
MTRVAVVVLVLGCGGSERAAVIETTTVAPITTPATTPVVEAKLQEPAQVVQRSPPAGWIDLRLAIPDAVFAIGYATKDNFTGAPLPGYGAPGAWLRDDAAGALRVASTALAKQGFRLVVFDAYRPRRASAAMVTWAQNAKRTDLLRDGFISARSQHNRGVAVDVGLADRDGNLLDMGTPWDFFGPEAHVAAVKGDAGDRRKALAQALRDAGFRPLAIEWWHFIHGKDNAEAELDVPYGVHEPD